MHVARAGETEELHVFGRGERTRVGAEQLQLRNLRALRRGREKQAVWHRDDFGEPICSDFVESGNGSDSVESFTRGTKSGPSIILRLWASRCTVETRRRTGATRRSSIRC